MKPIPILNVRANQRCPRRGRAQAAQVPEKRYSVAGATRIVQRVVCVGGDGRQACSAGGENQLRTYRAQASLEDVLAPVVSTRLDTPLTRGEWVSEDQPLNYDASDNVGVYSADVVIGGAAAGSSALPCSVAYAPTPVQPRPTFESQFPCPNGPGRTMSQTERVGEGTQPPVVRIQDPAGNVGESAPVMVRIDRTPPGRVDV